METNETNQNVTDEQGQVSSQAEPKDKETAEQIYEITKKLPPSFQKILLEELQKKYPELRLEEPEQEQPSIDKQTQGRVKAFFKNLDPKAKLAIVTFSEMQCLDGINFQTTQKKGKLIDEIWDDLQGTCIETYHTEPDDVIAVAVGTIDKEDYWLAGVWESSRMILQNC